jgi:transposase
MCRAAGVVLAYLPAYSPDLNPIEEAFAELKQWYRSNHRMQELLDMESFIRNGLDRVARRVAAHFSKARVGMPINDEGDDDFYAH